MNKRILAFELLDDNNLNDWYGWPTPADAWFYPILKGAVLLYALLYFRITIPDIDCVIEQRTADLKGWGINRK